MNRRDLLLGAAGLIAGCGKRAPAREITGSFVGASYEIGHLLRGGSLPTSSDSRRTKVVIIGGGVAGLSAGWRLARRGFQDFEILELEPEAGGNARFGENPVSAYPWGAHYVPIPTKESQFVRELFEELGVITGYENGEPVYKDEYLCFDPQERLFLHGRWQDGLVPTIGTTNRDRDDFERFKDITDEYKRRRAFTIPMEFSSHDKDVVELDSISIRDFLQARNLSSPALHWYVNYACRDDFGCNYADVSAWAGLHYFSSRDLDDAAVLTWPEGNGWIVKRLRERLADHIKTGMLVHRVSDTSVDVYDVHERRSSTIQSEHIIFACPTYLAKYLMENPPPIDEFTYAPWLVANLTLDAFPEERAGAPIAWDNVIYDSETLGYVVATHQSLRTFQPKTVFTFYYALSNLAPAAARDRLLKTDWKTWAEFILADLSKPHPEIRDLVTHIDIMRWGHAMARPTPGFISGSQRKMLTKPFGRIHFAHSDLSGFSLFEEAQYRGVTAADRVIA